MPPSQKVKDKGTLKPNRLLKETSTYLLQHAYNPVDWYAWGDEALSKARQEDRPILLSIGYAACHWCHVMEHESFEDEETAQIMNEHFVNIKVDREERTDLDEIYMKAVQMMTGHGGWPMTVFLTPNLKPFFGGTYFPPQDRHGLPGFKRLLLSIVEAWREQRQELSESADEITAHLQALDGVIAPLESHSILDRTLIEGAVEHLLNIFDHRWGGFGNAPKFPHTFALRLAMRAAAPYAPTKDSRKEELLELIATTLNRMADGGIHDQLAGGFARYSVDRQWLVPHFEKMLYDNALLSQAYLDGYLLTGNNYWKDVARGIFQFVKRELKADGGGFYSSLDADSEGVEGKFYVFDQGEINKTLGSDADWFCDLFGISKAGNFEHGKSVLHVAKSLSEVAEKHKLTEAELTGKLDSIKSRLLDERATRVRPTRDEKVLTSWNSLMISALVDGYKVIQDRDDLKAAKDCARFIMTNLVRDGRLLRTWGKGKAKLNAYLDDYAYFIQALIDLSSVDPDPSWFREAKRLAEIMIERFWDEATGTFFYTASDHEELVTRPKSHYDGSIPSVTSMAALALISLSKLTGLSDYMNKAERILALYGPFTTKAPDQFSNLLCGLDFYLSKPLEIALIADHTKGSGKQISQMLLHIHEKYIPNKVVLLSTAKNDTESPLVQGRKMIDGKPTVYICENFSCGQPITDPEALEEKLASLAAATIH